MCFKTKRTKVFGGVLISLFILGAQYSYADWGRDHDRWGRDHDHRGHYYRSHGDHYNDYPRDSFRLTFKPSENFSISLGEDRFYYSKGFYHRRFGQRYVVVDPPIGAVVRSIPSCYRPIKVNGITYYTDQGVYYVYTGTGYQLVPQPVTYIQSAPVVVNPASVIQVTTAANTFNGDDLYMVNVPNDHNGYTSVTIKRSGAGFVGPQGEYYADFPNVAQLKLMYVK